MAQVKEVELNSDIQTAMCDMDLSFLADAEVKQSRESSSSVGGESTEVDENTNTCNTAQPKEKQKQKDPKPKTGSRKGKSGKADKGSSSRKKKKGKSGSAPKPSDESLRQLVYEYMKDQNRPFNCVTVFQNLNKKVSNSQLKVFLSELVEEGKLQEKVYGKTSIFWISQTETVKEGTDLQVLLEKSQADGVDLKAKVQQLEGILAEKRKLNASILAEPSNESLVTRIASLQEESIAKKAKLANNGAELSSEHCDNSKNVDPAELKAQLKFYMSLWRERQENIYNIIEPMSEASGQTLALLQEQAGLEGDDAHGLPIRAPRSIAELSKYCTSS